MVTPTVSIIVPIYNRCNMLSDFYLSVKNQTFKDWELVFVDDSSTDSTLSRLHEIASIDSRVKIFKNLYSKGPSGARNTGLDNSVGKYIAYQDSDDEWMPYHLEVMVEYLNKHPDIDVMTADPLRKKKATGEVYHFDRLELNSNDYTLRDGCWVIHTDRLFDIQLRNRAITTQTIVGKSKILKQVRWNEVLRAATDNLHNLSLCSREIVVCHVPNYHVVYWAHGDNITNALNTHSDEKAEFYQKYFALFWLELINNFRLTKQQRKFCLSNLSQVYAWHIAYHLLEKNHRFGEAYTYYLRAFRVEPTNLLILRKLVTLPFKFILFFSKRFLGVRL